MELFKLLGTIALSGVAQAQKDIDDTSGKASSFGENLKKGITTVGKWGVTIGTAAVGATKALTSMATSSAATADNIDKMSQKIGISRQAYQELDFICSQSGTSVDTLQMGMKTLTAAMDGAASGTKSNVEQFEKLGIAVTDSDGNLRKQEDVMFDTMKALQEMDNQTEKARLATELFGRSGSELMPLLNGASGSIDEMKQQAHDLGLVLDDELIDNGVKMTDTVDQMKRAMSSLVTKLGGALMPIVTKLCNFIIKNLPNIEKMFNQLSPVLEQMFDDLLPVLMDLVDEFLPVIVDLVDDLLPIVSQLVKSVLPIFVDIIKTIVPPLAQIVEAILPPLKSMLDILLPILSGFLDVLQPILDVVVSLLQPILDLVGQGLNALAEAFGFAKEKTDAAVQAARDEADAMRDMRDAANEARDAIDQKAEKELANVSTVESLWQELQNLADEQGNVSEKDRARAEFITGQLSEALGTEIQWTGNQIQNYKDLQEEIDKTIEKKKMEILLEASEEKYKTAIQNRTDAEDRLNEASQRRAEAFTKLAELEEQGVDKSSEAWKNAQATAAATQEAFIEAQNIVGEYYSDISQYETAQTLIMQGENEKALELLDKKGQAFQAASDLASKSADEQKAILEKQMEDAAVNLSNQVELYNKMSKNCTDEEREMYEKNLKEAQDYFTRSSQEYTKAGGEIGENFFKSMSSKLTSWQFESVGSYMIQGIANGAEGNKTTLMQKLGKIMNEAFSSAYSNMNSGRTSSNTSTSSSYKTPHLAKGGVLKRGQIGFLEGDGDEAVVPLEKNTGWINKLADRLNNSGGGGDVVKKMDELIKAITSMNIVLDTGTMVGEIAPAMDAQLGNIYSAKERGM